MKTDFLSMAVHELRTPLTIITCGLEIIRSELEAKGVSGFDMHINNALDFASNMNFIVSDMLDINTISGELKEEVEQVAPSLFSEYPGSFMPKKTKNSAAKDFANFNLFGFNSPRLAAPKILRGIKPKLDTSRLALRSMEGFICVIDALKFLSRRKALSE